jgi:cold shock CspA family protein/ribosome-associated translation inhibitor RaiA
VQSPLEIRSDGVPVVEPLDTEIRARAARLEEFYSGIVACRVTLHQPPGHSQKGAPFEVDINLQVPGEHLVVNHRRNPDLRLAVGSAFDALERQLEDYVRRTRGFVKDDVKPPRGRVRLLFAEEGYGFIQSEDGRDVYFHRNSVLAPGFEALEPGLEVRYSEEQGEKGPQASTVVLAGHSGAPPSGGNPEEE